MIDNGPLSMLGNEISCSPALNREKVREGLHGEDRPEERGESNLLEIKSDGTDRAGEKRREELWESFSFYPLSSGPLSAIRVLHHSGSHLP